MDGSTKSRWISTYLCPLMSPAEISASVKLYMLCRRTRVSATASVASESGSISARREMELSLVASFTRLQTGSLFVQCL